MHSNSICLQNNDHVIYPFAAKFSSNHVEQVISFVREHTSLTSNSPGMILSIVFNDVTWPNRVIVDVINGFTNIVVQMVKLKEHTTHHGNA